MAGGGSPATGTGGGQTVFTPPNQGTAAFNFGNILQPFIDSSFTAANNLAGFQGGGFPESYVVPNAFQSTQNIVQNPYAGGALQSAFDAQNLITGGAIPNAIAGANYLQNLGNIATFPADQVVNQTLNNPAYTQAEGLGQQYGTGLPALGAGYGSNIAAAGENANAYAQQLGPYGQSIAGAAPGVAQYGQEVGNYGRAAAGPMLGTQQQLLNLGFDPQQALYNQTRGQTLDAANVANAMSGTASTPYGASVDANALGNFDINWQNNALNRAGIGASAAGQAGATGLADYTGGLAGEVGGLNALGTGMAGLQAGEAGLTTGVGNLATGYGTGLNLAGTGLQTGQGALLTPANNQSAATLQGTSALGNLISSAGGAYGAANNLRTGGAANLLSYGQQPYSIYQGQQGNNLSALANLTGLTNQQYALPQQTLQDLESYLGLGQSASTIANQIGATNFNEQLAGLQGIGGGIGLGNSLLGNPLGSIGSAGLGALGLGGGGGAAAIDAATGIPTGVGGLDIAGGGGLADAATAAGGSSSFAPLAFLGS